MVEKIKTLTKNFMQPVVTAWALYMGWRLFETGQFMTWNPLSLIVIGVIAFWLGNTFIKQIASVSSIPLSESPKASNQSTAPAGTGEQSQGVSISGGMPDGYVEPNSVTTTNGGKGYTQYDFNKNEWVQPSEPEPDEPLNVNEFIDAIENTESIMKNSGVINDSTRFYNAERVYNQWDFHDVKQIKKAKSIVLPYAKLAMASIWWVNPTDEQKADPITFVLNHLNNDPDCKTCETAENHKTLMDKANAFPSITYERSASDVLRWEEVNGIERDPSLIGH
jgi:hypothetical protein